MENISCVLESALKYQGSIGAGSVRHPFDPFSVSS